MTKTRQIFWGRYYSDVYKYCGALHLTIRHFGFAGYKYCGALHLAIRHFGFGAKNIAVGCTRTDNEHAPYDHQVFTSGAEHLNACRTIKRSHQTPRCSAPQDL